jgi:hypothetical protein
VRDEDLLDLPEQAVIVAVPVLAVVMAVPVVAVVMAVPVLVLVPVVVVLVRVRVRVVVVVVRMRSVRLGVSHQRSHLSRVCLAGLVGSTGLRDRAFNWSATCVSTQILSRVDAMAQGHFR